MNLFASASTSYKHTHILDYSPLSSSLLKRRYISLQNEYANWYAAYADTQIYIGLAFNYTNDLYTYTVTHTYTYNYTNDLHTYTQIYIQLYKRLTHIHSYTHICIQLYKRLTHTYTHIRYLSAESAYASLSPSKEFFSLLILITYNTAKVIHL